MEKPENRHTKLEKTSPSYQKVNGRSLIIKKSFPRRVRMGDLMNYLHELPGMMDLMDKKGKILFKWVGGVI